MKKAMEFLAMTSFGLIFFIPTIITTTILLYFGIDENIVVAMILITSILHYVIMMKVYGSSIANKIDSSFNTKTLTSTYEIKVKPSR